MNYHYPKISNHFRSGWTVIELIFVIIVIGILAAMALPRLASTRDDAKLSTTVHNMSVCIVDADAHYTATGLDYNDSVHSPACDENNTKCYIISYGTNGDLNVTTNPSAASYCADIDMVGGHLAKNYHFGGSRITR